MAMLSRKFLFDFHMCILSFISKSPLNTSKVTTFSISITVNDWKSTWRIDEDEMILSLNVIARKLMRGRYYMST